MPNNRCGRFFSYREKLIDRVMEMNIEEMKTVKSTGLHLTGERVSQSLAGVYFQGVHYYDMGKVEYINHSGIAELIDLVKDWMEQGIEVRFINVPDGIKREFEKLDLDHIIDFE